MFDHVTQIRIVEMVFKKLEKLVSTVLLMQNTVIQIVQMGKSILMKLAKIVLQIYKHASLSVEMEFQNKLLENNVIMDQQITGKMGNVDYVVRLLIVVVMVSKMSEKTASLAHKTASDAQLLSVKNAFNVLAHLQISLHDSLIEINLKQFFGINRKNTHGHTPLNLKLDTREM